MWTRFKNFMKGWKTIVWARCLMLAGALPAALDFLQVVDAQQLLRPEWVPYYVVAIGAVTEILRRATTGPVGSKESK